MVPLDSTETSPSSSFTGDELSPVSVSLSRGSRLSADPTCQPLSLSPWCVVSTILQILCCFCKIHNSSYTDPNGVIPILLGSCVSLVFIKNIKHAMFLHK